jgi:uncharacterized protein
MRDAAMNFVDHGLLKGVKRTADGFLVAEVLAARSGIQTYAGAELGLDLPYVSVWRPSDEVFSKASLQSFSHIPVTLDHPRVPVTSENWKDLAVGEVSSEVLRDGERLAIPLVLKDAEAIKAVEAGKRQLSVGYHCEIEFADGVTPSGQSYQAIQRNIRANHLAVVNVARAGPDFKIGDQWIAPMFDDGDNKMTTTLPSFKSVTIDGITIQTTDQGAEAIAKLQKQLTDSAASIAALTATVGEKDKEVGALKVDIKKLQDAPKPDLDKLVLARTTLLEAAKSIAKDLDPKGLTDEEIRKRAVIVAFGEDMVKDASAAQIEGMFLAATKTTSRKDPVADAISKQQHSAPPPADMGQSAYEKRLTDAWKTAGHKVA